MITIIAALLLQFVSSLNAGHTIYIPAVYVQGDYQRIGIAPGGVRYGDLTWLAPEWSYAWHGTTLHEWGADHPRLVQMIWGREAMGKEITAQYLLGFNEPNLCGQSNLSPREAAQLWRRIEATHPGRYLISPAPAQPVWDADCQRESRGMEWLVDMAAEYRGLYGTAPHFDAIAFHFYETDTSISFEVYAQQVRERMAQIGYDVPLWATEIGSLRSNKAQRLHAIFDYVRDNTWIARVAWYKIRPDSYDPDLGTSLVDGDGKLTELGEAWLNWITIWMWDKE
jgi:hypothetical protein